jgi:hypothetical protein
MSLIPEQFLREGMILGEGTRIFGVELSELSREELIAVAAQGWNAERKLRDIYYGECAKIFLEG